MVQKFRKGRYISKYGWMASLSSESEENIIKLDDFKVKFNPYQDLNTSINSEELQR